MVPKICSVEECERPKLSRGMCQKHYLAWRKATPKELRPNLTGGSSPIPWEERVWKYVNKTESCWLWIGTMDTRGYGQIQRSRKDRDAIRLGRSVRAHRAVYEVIKGPIPEGLDLDHLCRVRHCVNPAHLEPVTRKVNILRGETLPAANAAKTHCVNGHEFSVENTYLRQYSKNGISRVCRRCGADQKAKSKAKIRAAKIRPDLLAEHFPKENAA